MTDEGDYIIMCGIIWNIRYVLVRMDAEFEYWPYREPKWHCMPQGGCCTS